MAFSTRFEIASRVDILLLQFARSFESKPLRSSFISGSLSAVSDSDLRSLGVAVLYMTLVMSLSRS